MKHGSAGFTLLELLVVMSLMSLLILAMASALRTTSQTSERIDHALTRADDLRIVSGFLQLVLGRVSLQKRPYPHEVGTGQYFFEGDGKQITWLGVMPAGYAAGGRTLMRLQHQNTAQGKPALLLQYLPWTDAATEPNWALASTQVLLSDVSQVQFMYQDARPEPPTWTSQWDLQDAMPYRVRISIQTEQGVWPELIVTLRPMPSSDPRSRGPVFGGDIR